MPVETLAGHRVHHSVTGDGPRPALLIHAALAHAGAWTGVCERLGSRLTMTLFDLPGHGRSGDWDGQADLHELSTAIAAALACRALAGGAPALDLVGHSFGATVALRLSAEAAVPLRSLTLIEPVLFAAAAGDPRLADHLAARRPFLAALRAGRRAEAARVFLDDWGTGGSWADLPAAQRAALAARIALIPAGDRALYDDGAGLLSPGRLEGVDAPVCLIAGERSPAVMEAVMTALAARLGNVTRATLPGAGHMAPVTHPGLVADAIATHLARS